MISYYSNRCYWGKNVWIWVIDPWISRNMSKCLNENKKISTFKSKSCIKLTNYRLRVKKPKATTQIALKINFIWFDQCDSLLISSYIPIFVFHLSIPLIKVVQLKMCFILQRDQTPWTWNNCFLITLTV